MTTVFKRVPAIDKCFAVLELFAKSTEPLGISEISRQLAINKSTVFNMVHTLADLDVLEYVQDGKFRFGIRLYVLGNTAGKKSEHIQIVHPFLEKINQKLKFSAFLGIRSDFKAVIIDKVDSANDIRISSEIGMHLPLLAGAGGKALLSQLSDQEIDDILKNCPIQKFTQYTIVDKDDYRKEIFRTRKEGIAFDREEYIEGIVAFAMPVMTYRKGAQAAIWAVGLKQQVNENKIRKFSIFLKEIAEAINSRFAIIDGHGV